MGLKQTPKVETRAGRPPSPYPRRSYYRHNDQQMERWKRAAASCGLPLGDWMLMTLDSEAASSKHVPMIRAKGSRRG